MQVAAGFDKRTLITSKSRNNYSFNNILNLRDVVRQPLQYYLRHNTGIMLFFAWLCSIVNTLTFVTFWRFSSIYSPTLLRKELPLDAHDMQTWLQTGKNKHHFHFLSISTISPINWWDLPILVDCNLLPQFTPGVRMLPNPNVIAMLFAALLKQSTFVVSRCVL